MEEFVKNYIKWDDESSLQQYICNPANLVVDDLNRTQKHWNRKLNVQQLYDFDVSPLNTTLKVNRDSKTGALTNFYEVEDSCIGKSIKTSMSLDRPPGPVTENVKGSATNMPFLPGGMDEVAMDIPIIDELDSSIVDFENDLLTVPPGFDHGMNFNNVSQLNEVLLSESNDDDKVVVSTDLFNDDDNELLSMLESENSELSVESKPIKKVSEKPMEITSAGTMSFKDNRPKWAVVIDVTKPVEDFSSKVPVMAREWPFELDNFQKQAIIRLERHESVFVAAHTSAGKTVVAEYAIALSLKHMTRTIYTSPIKALSNQKYRDFKLEFKDVGLITGDVQIRPEAACLIMTTEILRSMLYNGSDIIRELEWVIFDEVHYINDKERGVVWEEVIILLPSHVNVVLLSATVPNTVEFAEWIGMTKRKKVYVVSTVKRPVPLEHYLFTGSDTKSQKDLYKIVDATNKFKPESFTIAKEIMKKKWESRAKKGVTNTYTTRTQERNIWINVVNSMKSLNQLPIIAFMFSRKLCDQNANMLTSVDLSTTTEKNRINEFIMKSLQNLKGSDIDLPQVMIMRELLTRGIGVHHSGILPILKELVELLFQQGFVKLLFATETFAMGVNMPARTVIFDSITKFDGHQKRQLRTDEYIQMAGRAGRRGLDLTGMTAILCKNDIPEKSAIELMIQGKSTSLESRFRLTYGMILSLLRVNQFRVEDMMKRSFSEIGMQKNFSNFEHKATILQQQLLQLPTIDCSLCQPIIKDYSKLAILAVELKQKNLKFAVSYPPSNKVFSPGRVIVVATKAAATLGVVVKTINGRQSELSFNVLIKVDSNFGGETTSLEKSENANVRNWIHIWNVLQCHASAMDDGYTNEVIRCTVDDIILVSQSVIQIDGDKVFADWEKRQIPRFKNDSPSQSFVSASQQLAALINRELKEVDFNIKDLDYCEKEMHILKLKAEMKEFSCCSCAAFEEHLKAQFESLTLESELASAQHKISEDSLVLLPEYKQRVEILKKLGYIDDSMAVQLKGRVACEISSHELIITELVFNNILNQFQPAEIAAILSCTVFQGKSRNDDEIPELNETLTKGTEDVKNIIERISIIERQHYLPCDSFEDQFNFGLTSVVYEWARGVPFSEIMKMTEIQEGIIVRCIQRLDEILRNVKDGARIIGDQVLFKKMDTASQAIKRDIVFAASLYTHD